MGIHTRCFKLKEMMPPATRIARLMVLSPRWILATRTNMKQRISSPLRSIYFVWLLTMVKGRATGPAGPTHSQVDSRYRWRQHSNFIASDFQEESYWVIDMNGKSWYAIIRRGQSWY